MRAGVSIVNSMYATGADARPRIEIVLDVIGTCNLRCPSCPVGNTGRAEELRAIDVPLFERIIAKAARDYQVHQVMLYNWAEPMLHPNLPELVSIVKQHGLFCNLSSNLNLLRRADDLLAAGPDELRVSVSGFTQAVYSVAHRRGDIERVKRNMIELSKARQRVGATTRLELFFHKYRHNLSDLAPMREYAENLGFDWLEEWAMFFPMEKVADAAEGDLSESDQRFVNDRYALPLIEALDEARTVRHEPCRLLNEQIVLDLEGRVLLCCAVYDQAKHRMGSFLELDPSEISAAKTGNPSCSRCTSHGIHRYFEFRQNPSLAPVFDNLALHNVGASRS